MKKFLPVLISIILTVIFAVFVFLIYLQTQKPLQVLPQRYKAEELKSESKNEVSTSSISASVMFVYKDLIKIKTPLPNSKIENPLIVEGEARGNWFFEGSFPIMLVNWDGLIIGSGIAQAQGEWMTENFVPFKAEIKFVKPDYKNSGALILKKDNPSGLPKNDDAVEIPIFFE